MTAVAMTWSLNPLAPCFVPSSRLTMVCRSESNILLPIVNENKVEALPKKLSEDENSSDVETENTLSLTILDPRMKIELFLWKKLIMRASLPGGSTASRYALKNAESFLMYAESACLKNLGSPMLPENLSDGKEIDRTGCIEFIDTPETPALEKEVKDYEECHCPAMFGWIVPPDFFGNPFNLKYDCKKRYAHIATCLENKSTDVDKLESLDTEINELTVDQCYLEVKNILADVYESVCNDSDPISEWEEKYKIQDFLEVSDDELDDECDEPKRFSWSPVPETEISKTSEIVDDGCHPLLQSLLVGRTEDKNEVSMETIEKILGYSLMPAEKQQSLDCTFEDSKAVCNPPCTVWCDSLPSAAKDTFKKFVKKSKTNQFCHERKPDGDKPLYKRSFSADDAPQYVQFIQSLLHPTSLAESRERLMLLRKDPVSYFLHHAPNTLKDGKNKYRSSSYSDCHLRGSLNKGDGSDMWGPFDGADSLWQPLPDCLPCNEHNPKQNHKRVREMRRQRSVS